MTTLRNGDRKIDITVGTITEEIKTITTKETMYMITLPKICCNNEEDAKSIESTVNKFIRDLVKNVLEMEG